MSKNHTHGPWFVEIEATGQSIVTIWSASEKIASVEQSSNALANARVIAAAPELLDKLRACFNYLHGNAPDYLIAEVELIIGKAEGRKL